MRSGVVCVSKYVAGFVVLTLIAGCGEVGHSFYVPTAQTTPTRGNSGGNSSDVSNVTGVGNYTNVRNSLASNVAVNSLESTPMTFSAIPPVSYNANVPQVYATAPGTVEIGFDDGPSPYTMGIIHVLEQYHVKASFFFVGSRVKYWPTAVQQAALDGDTIGDHTVSHPVLTNLTPQQQAWQIFQGAKEIQVDDPYPITLFRPPYEAFNSATDDILASDHLAMALWNRDPRDWAAKSVQQIVNNVLGGSPSGGIFDMHDTQLTLQALPAILAGLQKDHLQVVAMAAPSYLTGISVNQHSQPTVDYSGGNITGNVGNNNVTSSISVNTTITGANNAVLANLVTGNLAVVANVSNTPSNNSVQ